jgi:hypothetical protein
MQVNNRVGITRLNGVILKQIVTAAGDIYQRISQREEWLACSRDKPWWETPCVEVSGGSSSRLSSSGSWPFPSKFS